MNVKRSTAASVWLPIALCLSSGSAAADDDQRAYMLASSCAACHGPGGNSPGAIPSLAGKDSDYLAEAMKAFRSDERSATVMNRLAKGYSDEDIALLADWFAAQR